MLTMDVSGMPVLTLPAATQCETNKIELRTDDVDEITVTADGTKIIGQKAFIVHKGETLIVQYRAGQWRRPIPVDE